MTPEEIARNKRLQNAQTSRPQMHARVPKIQTDTPQVPDKYDMQAMIGYLHKKAGRIPTESECLRFHMFLNSFAGEPSERECTEFLMLMGVMRK
jgi:uncharacterized SAM-dependent methyltransferase